MWPTLPNRMAVEVSELVFLNTSRQAAFLAVEAHSQRGTLRSFEMVH